MDTKKTAKKKENNPLIETIRGEKMKAIGANIFRGQSSDGNFSHYFALSRAWKRQDSEKFFYSDRFYPRNAEAMVEVSEKAAARCKELDASLSSEDLLVDEIVITEAA